MLGTVGLYYIDATLPCGTLHFHDGEIWVPKQNVGTNSTLKKFKIVHKTKLD